MRQFHDLDVDIKRDVDGAIVEGENPINSAHPSDEREQVRLAPDDNLAGDASQRRREADEDFAVKNDEGVIERIMNVAGR